MDGQTDSSRASRANLKIGAKGRGGKGRSKGTSGKSKGNAESANSLPGGKSKGKLKGLRSDRGKGKSDTHASRLRLTAQECYSEPKCVMILQQRYGCQVGDVLDTEGQSKDDRNWLEARGDRTLPKCHEGVGWKKLHGDVERPNRICIDHDFYGCGEDAVLRIEGETEDHRSWLTECGKEIPKKQINVFWHALDSSSEENPSCDDDSSSGLDFNGHQSLDSSERHRVPSSDGLSDALCDHERFPECLRDERPDLDSDGLEDLYHGMLQDDAEEFAGYQCDSD